MEHRDPEIRPPISILRPEATSHITSLEIKDSSQLAHAWLALPADRTGPWCLPKLTALTFENCRMIKASLLTAMMYRYGIEDDTAGDASGTADGQDGQDEMVQAQALTDNHRSRGEHSIVKYPYASES